MCCTRVTQSPLDNANFPWLSCREIEVAGTTVRTLRVSYTGELGWEFHAPMNDMPGIYDAVMTAGQDFGHRELRVIRSQFHAA